MERHNNIMAWQNEDKVQAPSVRVEVGNAHSKRRVIQM